MALSAKLRLRELKFAALYGVRETVTKDIKKANKIGINGRHKFSEQRAKLGKRFSNLINDKVF